MEEFSARSTTFSNLTNNDNLSKCTKDSLTSQSSTNNTNSYTTFKSSFANSTIRTTLSMEEIESRRSGFSQFINSLPKICSPTICGTLNYKTPNSKLFTSVNSTKVTNNKSNDDTSGYQTSSQNKVEQHLVENNKDVESATGANECKEEQKFTNPFEEQINQMLKEHSAKSNEMNETDANKEDNNEFDWSIDQIALLNPCDIPFDENYLLYKEFAELDRSALNKESEEFFKQNVIAPSPIVNTPILTRKRIIQNMCKTSSPFIEYLNSKKKSMFKTPLQLSGIKSVASSNGVLSSKTPRTCTPINELSVIENLPKKKLFHKFESSSLAKSTPHSNMMANESPALSEISANPLNNRFNCTDLDVRRFTLDMSEIGGEINLTELGHVIKSSTNRKEMLNRLIEEDLLEEDENEIQELNLNDTNEEINCDNLGVIDCKASNEPESQRKVEETHVLTDVAAEDENKINEEEEDIRMSISMHQEAIQNNSSMMECSFQSPPPPPPSSSHRNSPVLESVSQAGTSSHVNNVNELFNQINQLQNKQSYLTNLNQPVLDQPSSTDDTQLMETSSAQISDAICTIDKFNDKIDPICKSSTFKNHQLTSTPFRF